jgi:hypothetical protein
MFATCEAQDTPGGGPGRRRARPAEAAQRCACFLPSESGCAVCSFMASGRCGSVCEVYWLVSLWCEECQDPTSNIRQRLFALVEVVEENLDGTTLHSIVLGHDEINDCRSCAYKQ